VDADFMLAHWDRVRARLLQAIDKFVDTDLDFRPYANSWSVRQIILHIGQEENGEYNYGIRQTLPAFPAEYDPLSFPTKESLRDVLAAIHAPIVSDLIGWAEADWEQLITTPWGGTYHRIEMISHLLEHEIHHRGELSLILGMLGREGLDA
jgi:uncharacterized damage-inducible protein DinB